MISRIPDVKRVVLTGSESTGKTTLAVELAHHYGTLCCVEFVRGYLDGRAGPLGSSDVEPIARGQIELEDSFLSRVSRILIQDTDLVSTVVYARHYYGSCPQWIVDAARKRQADLYLLLGIDVPWVADPQRDRGHMRDEMQALFVGVLIEIGAEFVPVEGSWEQRRATAIRAIDALLL